MRENHTIPDRGDCPAQLQRAADYIQNHYAEDLSLEQLASVACYSKYHFHRLFREHFGESVHDCIRRIRLERAAFRIINDPVASVARVAESCGFSTSQNFARAFRAHFGFPPTSAKKEPYRRMIRPMENRQTASGNHSPLHVEIKDLPSCHVACIRHFGPYLSESSKCAVERLVLWAFTRGLADANVKWLAVGWNNPEETPPAECIMDVCLTVPEWTKEDGEVHRQVIAGGLHAVLHCEIELEAIAGQRKRLFYEWLPLSGYKRNDRPFFVIYYNNPQANPQKIAIVDICLPLKP